MVEGLPVSTDRSDDDAPTELDVELCSASSAEITITSAGEKPVSRDTLPADSEPSTLEPQMLVRGLGIAETRLLKAYAEEVQGAQDRSAARARARPPTLPTIITPSEPFWTLPNAKVAPPARPLPIEEEEEATVTGATVRPPPARAAIDTVDDVTSVTGPPQMLSSSELTTDPGASDAATVDGATDPGVELVVIKDDDDGTTTIVLLPEPVSALFVAPPLIPTPLPVPAALPAVIDTSRRPRHRGSSRGPIAIAVLVALAMLGLTVLLDRWALLSRPTADVAPPAQASAVALIAPVPPVAEPDLELDPGPATPVGSVSASPPAAPPFVAPRIVKPAPRPLVKPPPAPSPSSSQKAWAPLHI